MTSGPHAGSQSERLEGFLDEPRRGLRSLALPVLAGMSVHTLYMIADMIFVGRVSAEAITALAYNMPLIFFGLGVVFGLGSGITTVVASYVGAGDKRNADNSAEHAVALGLVLAVILTAAGLYWGESLLALLGVGPELMPDAWGYFRVMATGYTFMVLSVFFRSILSGEGDTKTPMMILGAATLLNIGLDPLFIFTLDLGVRGAAMATLTCQALATLAFVYLLFAKRRAYITFAPRDFSFSPRILGRIFRIGAPASFSFLIIAFGGGVFNRILSEISSDAVAAFQIGLRLEHVFLLPVMSTGAGLVTLVAMFRGAGRLDLQNEIIAYAMRLVVVIAIATGTLFFIFAPALVSMFTESAAIVGIGTTYFRYTVFAYPFVAVSMLSGRILQGSGRGMPILVITALRVIVLSAPVSYWLVIHRGHGVEAVLLAMVASILVATAVAVVWLRTGLRNDTLQFSPST